LGNVDNTADINKPASQPVLALFNAYSLVVAPKNNPTFTGTVSDITQAMVGLGDVDNTADINKPASQPVLALFNAYSLVVAPKTTRHSLAPSVASPKPWLGLVM
ncbi:MAG: hypothetical protein ACKPKO_25770, partial [Candidatus Fonsibacter sp.]